VVWDFFSVFSGSINKSGKFYQKNIFPALSREVEKISVAAVGDAVEHAVRRSGFFDAD